MADFCNDGRRGEGRGEEQKGEGCGVGAEECGGCFDNVERVWQVSGGGLRRGAGCCWGCERGLQVSEEGLVGFYELDESAHVFWFGHAGTFGEATARRFGSESKDDPV